MVARFISVGDDLILPPSVEVPLENLMTLPDLDDVVDTATRVAMTPAERTKLGGVSDGATANQTDAYLLDRTNHTGTTDVTDITGLDKAAVGLGNVDNTSDINKPVSTAQATALSSKADLVGGKIPVSQIPDIAVSDYLGAVASEASMLALSGQKGDWATRTDLGTTWLITGSDPTQLASWTALSYPAAPVLSVNGQTGTPTLEGITTAAAAKTTPIDADVMPVVDSAASNVWKKVTWANIKATLKSYFDTLYSVTGHTHNAVAGVTISGTPTSGQVPTATSGTAATWQTPASSTPPDASTTVKGIAELATNAETLTGTDTDRIVTPAGLQAKIDALDGIMGQAFVIQGLTGARVDQRSGDALGTNTSAIWVGEGTSATNQQAGDIVIDTTAYSTIIPILVKEVLFSYTVPAAATVFNANAATLRFTNLAGFTQARLIQVRHSSLTHGAAGSKIKLMYTPLASGIVMTPASMNELCTSALESPIDAAGTISGIHDSGWIDLAAGAKADIIIAPVVSGGNGSTSVNFQGVYLVVR